MIKNIKEELERLENFSEVIGTALVNRNGLLISSRLPRDIDERRFGALAAAMFQATETATSSLGTNQINNITVEYQDYQFIVVDIDDNIIFVSLFDLNVDLGLIFIEIEEFVQNVKNIINK
ncbi:MAG: roadblock/LC7 domain-containing protein [Candidatus Hodarchaeota archaeon]